MSSIGLKGKVKKSPSIRQSNISKIDYSSIQGGSQIDESDQKGSNNGSPNRVVEGDPISINQKTQNIEGNIKDGLAFDVVSGAGSFFDDLGDKTPKARNS